MSSLLTLVLLVALIALLGSNFATTRPAIRVGSGTSRLDPSMAYTHCGFNPPSPFPSRSVSLAQSTGRPQGPPQRRTRVPLTTSDPMARYRAVTGVGAHTRWWQKILSLMALGALVLVIGALIAALMGLIVVGARIMLDVIVS